MPLSIVILAAGQGTRMRSDLPKVLQPLGGSTLLEHVVATAQQLDPHTVHVVYGHGGDKVPRYLSHLQVNWVLQEQQLGTGHAVMQAMQGIPSDHTVLVLYGDVPLVTAQTLQPLVDMGSSALALLTTRLDDPAGYGRILRDAQGRVLRIVEHKDATAEERLVEEVNTGLLAAPADKLAGWLQRLGKDNSQGEYYLTDCVGMACDESYAVQGVIADDPEEVSGVNDRMQLAQAEDEYRMRQSERMMRAGVTLRDPLRVDIRGHLRCGRDVVIDIGVVVEGDVELGDRVSVGPYTVLRNSRVGADTQIHSHTVIDGAVVGEDCRIGPYARIRPETTLARNVHVGNFVEIKKSEVGISSKINHLSYVGDSSIGKRVNIGAGTITCNYDGVNKHRTEIGDDVFVGSDTQFVAPVTIGAGATIGAGSTITRDVPPGELTLSRSKQATVSGWKRPGSRKA